MLSTQILALAKTQPWMVAQRFIDVLPEVDPQMVKYELRELVNRKRLISCNGHFGVEYALPDAVKQERPEYKPQNPERPAQTRLSKAPLSDAAPNAPVRPAAPEKSPSKSRLKAPTAIPAVIAERAPDPKPDLELRIREALLDGMLSRTPLSVVALQSRLLTNVDASTAAIKRVLEKLKLEGVVESRGSRNWIRYYLKLNSSPARAGVPADESTVSETAPLAATANNGDSEAIERPSPDVAAPDGAAPDLTGGCAEHPELEPIDPELWKPEPYPLLPVEKRAVTHHCGASGCESIEGAAVAEPEPETLPPPINPRFALWSDGRLQMQFAGKEHVLPRNATRELFRYLTAINYQATIESHA